MKRLLAILFFSSVLSVIAGCDQVQSGSRGVVVIGDGVVDTTSERARRVNMVWDINAKELADDWDYFWLQDRECRLTMWHPRAN